jgi:pimeloyl-ACP methyl ester carboxylesterase
MSEPPAEIDSSKPHSARVYDYFLGGTNNFAVDREAAAQVLRNSPSVRTAARENRAFLGRAVHYLAAEASIRQGLAPGAWLAGMNPDGGREVEWAQSGELVLLRELAVQQQQIAGKLSGGPGALFGDEISDADRAYLERPEVIQALEGVVAEQAAHGVYGWADDSLAFISPWGFAPDTIGIPVLITYGLADGHVPPAHGAWLAANITTAATVISEAGHIPTDPVAEIADHMAWLRHGIVPAA